MFKLIISPEFGERIDLEDLTRALMEQMERDLGTTLEWVAVTHFNTSHPHVHVALRGTNDRGQTLRLERDYVRFGIRRHAEDLCTAKLGYRTQSDAEEAQRREIDQYRYTSLDHLINRMNTGRVTNDQDPRYFTVLVNRAPHLNGFVRAQQHHVAARLLALEKMGLAEPTEAGTWQVRRDFENVLRAMQRAGDRQKTLAAHGSLLSDERLPHQVTPARAVNDLEGRVLGHGQEDTTGRAYILIEGTDAKVHFIYYDDGIESARHRGLMHVNSFVRLRKSFTDGRIKLNVDDLGDAEKLLDNEPFIRRRALQLVRTGVLAHEEPRWGGWLGRFQSRMRAEILTLEARTRPPGRNRLGGHERQ